MQFCYTENNSVLVSSTESSATSESATSESATSESFEEMNVIHRTLASLILHIPVSIN